MPSSPKHFFMNTNRLKILCSIISCVQSVITIKHFRDLSVILQCARSHLATLKKPYGCLSTNKFNIKTNKITSHANFPSDTLPSARDEVITSHHHYTIYFYDGRGRPRRQFARISRSPFGRWLLEREKYSLGNAIIGPLPLTEHFCAAWKNFRFKLKKQTGVPNRIHNNNNNKQIGRAR